MEDKSYVTLAICPICKKETGTILMDRRLKPTFSHQTLTPEPCDKCRKKYLTKGVMLLCPDTGSLLVLKESAFKRLFNKPIPKGKICFTEQAVLDNLNQKRS